MQIFQILVNSWHTLILKTQHREHNSNNTASTTDFEWNNGRNKVSAWEGLQELESVKDTPSKN